MYILILIHIDFAFYSMAQKITVKYCNKQGKYAESFQEESEE